MGLFWEKAVVMASGKFTTTKHGLEQCSLSVVQLRLNCVGPYLTAVNSVHFMTLDAQLRANLLSHVSVLWRILSFYQVVLHNYTLLYALQAIDTPEKCLIEWS